MPFFCAPHWGTQCSAGSCRAAAERVPRALRQLGGRPRALLLHLHIEKTGGSAIECAVNQSEALGSLVLLLGHARQEQLDRCRTACTVYPGVAPQVVLVVREPYSWWRSSYLYGLLGTRVARSARTELSHFADFVAQRFDEHRRARGGAVQFHGSQSGLLRRSCGEPCLFDHLLHTENLATEWSALLRRLELPPVQLSEFNPTPHSFKNGSALPQTVFSRAVTEAVHAMERRLFADFNYSHRTDVPFELTR